MQTLARIKTRLNAWLASPLTRKQRKFKVCLWRLGRDPRRMNQIKIALAVGFLASLMWLTDSIAVGVVVFVGIYVHEVGHLWAMRAAGLKTKGIWHIPFLGAATVGTGMDRLDPWRTWLIMSMGPAWGFGFAYLLWLGYDHIGEELWFEYLQLQDEWLYTGAFVLHEWSYAVGWLMIINGLNLLPLPFLDGGRMIIEVLRGLKGLKLVWVRVVMLLVSLWLWYVTDVELFLVLGLLSALFLIEPEHNTGSMTGPERLMATGMHVVLFWATAQVVLEAMDSALMHEEHMELFAKRSSRSF